MKKYYDKTIYNPNSGLLKALCVDWWLTRVTLVVAFGFVAQKFGEMAGTYESFEFFTVCTKLAEMAILYSKHSTTAKKSYLQWGST